MITKFVINMITEFVFIKNRKLIESKQGHKCIYQEQLLIFPCVLESCSCDSWGISLGIQPINKPGFICPGETFSVSKGWDWGGIYGDTWCGGQGANWTLYFDEDLLRSLEEIAADVAELEPYERYRRLTNRLWNTCESHFETN